LTSSASNLASQFLDLGPVRRIDRWLHAMPHPSFAVEIAPTHVAAARWSRTGSSLESFASEEVAPGAVIPSPIETNVQNADAVRGALRRVFSHIPHHSGSLALLLPDPAVRVFILPFDSFPRRADEALPLLRWRLKKSVPFDVEETTISWSRQTGRSGGLEIVAAVARQKIIREFEELIESLGAHPGVVLSSALATLPLLEERGASLLVRMAGRTLTTVVVRGGNVCVFRSAEMAAGSGLLEPQAVLDEIFPALAFFQDTSGGSIDRVRISGFGAREEIFRRALSGELKCAVDPLSRAEGAASLNVEEKDMIARGLEPLAGWMKGGRS
jgi:type IV pilus assembly protein PilM